MDVLPVTDRSNGNSGGEGQPTGPCRSILGFAPEGKVFFDYNLEGTDWPTGGFTSSAEADLDEQHGTSIFTISSDTSEIFHRGATH